VRQAILMAYSLSIYVKKQMLTTTMRLIPTTSQAIQCQSKFWQTLLRRYQETGRCDALPHGGGKQPKLNREHLEILQQLVASNNDATLEDMWAFGSKLKFELVYPQ